MPKKNIGVVTSNDTDEAQELKKDIMDELLEKRRRSILSLCRNADFQEYLVGKLSAVMLRSDYGGGAEATAYNLGKSEAYKEILLDIKDAATIADTDDKTAINEIINYWFYN